MQHPDNLNRPPRGVVNDRAGKDWNLSGSWVRSVRIWPSCGFCAGNRIAFRSERITLKRNARPAFREHPILISLEVISSRS
jgi:hypothetical protein